MLPELWRAFHLSPKVFYLICLSVLLLATLILGLVLSRVFRRYARKFQSTWAEILFSLLEPLPIPLLILAALYTALEVLTPPQVYERLGSKLISSLVILVVFYFPAKVVILFLCRVCSRHPVLEGVTHFVVVITRALFVLL